MEGETGSLTLRVAEPRCWSHADPFLYTLRGETLKEGKVTDQETIPFGLRTFRFDPDHGFFLNGENMKLKGVCVHHDGGCLGAAVPKNVWRIRRRSRDLKKAKSFLFTAISLRLSPGVRYCRL